MGATNGNTVKVEYKGTFDDATIFDSSEAKEPLEFELGAGQVIRGFENAILGMEEGEEKQIRLSPSEAYGEYNPQLIKQIPRHKLPKEELKPGMMLAVGLPNGVQVPARIVEAGAEFVKIDFNHPLAGKTLNFRIKLISIS